MTELLPPTEHGITQIVAHVLETVSGLGVELPPLVVVDDGGCDWRRLVVSRSTEERRRSVIAVSSIESLVDAVRLQLGGALWLPASTPSLEAACEAAAAGWHCGSESIITRHILDMVTVRATRVHVVTWAPRSFWGRQLGAAQWKAWLIAIADELEAVPAVIPWPALVVADRSPAEIDRACESAVDDRGALAGARPVVVEVSEAAGSSDSWDVIEPALREADRAEDRTSATDAVAKPVHELPGGGRVGWWARQDVVDPPESGWLAWPVQPTSLGHQWQLTGGPGEVSDIVDIVRIETVEGRPQPAAFRVPGWIAFDVRRGSPAGLLVEGMARDPSRGGRPLWVPNVEVESVRFLLTLPGPIWVDGPGVPR